VLTSVARAQAPEVSVAAMARPCEDLSAYCPVAVQFPAEEHERLRRVISGLPPALAGAVTSVARAQAPEVSVAAEAWKFPELSS
jgi:hypothetical protein